MAKHPNGYGSVRKLSGNRRNPYQVIVTVGWENGKQIQKAIGYTRTRAEALFLLSDYNKDPYAVQENLTFEEVYERLDLSHKSDSMKRCLKTAYKRCEKIHKAKMRNIKTGHLQELANSFSKLSPASHSEVKMLWRMIFDYSLKNDIIIKDYSRFVNFFSEYEPDTKLPFTADEVNRFSDDLLILCLTGMRISEYLSMKTEDIHDGCFFVNGTKTTSAVRIIPIHNKIAEIVNLRLTGVYLCEGLDGAMLYDYFLKKVFNPEMERLGITGHTIHDTRRTFATFASRSGMDKGITKRILGHKLNDITEDIYTHKNYEDLRNEMDKLKIL